LTGSQRTSLPNRKTSLPDRPSGAPAEPPPIRYVFNRKTLNCLVERARTNSLPAGDPVHVDLSECP
jgi:hypothetical protein